LEELDAVFVVAYNPFRRADVFYTNNERGDETPKGAPWVDQVSKTSEPDVVVV
jgi:hypothetical protein